jgi:hypothetical protein
VALLAFWTLSVVTIVGFGVNKARYVYYTQWILLFFWVTGLAPLTRAVLDRARRIGPLPARAWTLLAAALLALVVVAWGVRLGAPRHVAPLGAELGFFALALGLTGLAAWRQAGPSLPLVLLLVVAAAPLVGGGLVGKRDALYKVHHANHSAWLLAPWLAENLGSDDRVVLLPRAHVVHLTGISPRRLVPFSSLDAESPTELARLMGERGLTHVAYTYRGSVRNPSQAYYHRIKNVALAEFFAEGADVPGFEHLATLPLPSELSRPAVQVYRLRPARPTAG